MMGDGFDGSRPTDGFSGGGSRGRDLEERLNKLSLVCWAMWTLIQESTDLTEADLLQRFHDLDKIDGTADGLITAQLAKCSSCGRVMSPQNLNCIYCGARRPIHSAFDHLF